MLRSGDKQALLGTPISERFARGRLERVSYRKMPPLTPTYVWMDGSAWFDFDNATDNYMSSAGVISIWRNRAQWAYPASIGGGSISLDAGLARYPVSSITGAGTAENRYRFTTLPALARPYSVFAVALCTNFSTQRSLIGSTASGGFAWRINTSGQFEILSSGVAIRATSALTVTANTAFAAGVVLDATTITHYVDTSSEVDSNNTAISISSGGGAMEIGSDTAPAGTAPWLGWFGEVMVYSSALGSTDATNVIQYLKNKWDV